MSLYLLLKWVHILSATILFGTGIGIAFFKWMTDRSGDVRAIRIINERTVLADLVFTTPAVIAQPVSGVALMLVGGYPIHSPWLVAAIILYVFAGSCWLPVLWLQIRMRDLAQRADQENLPLNTQYWRYARRWFCLGVPAFLSLVIVFWLMVFKPSL